MTTKYRNIILGSLVAACGPVFVSCDDVNPDDRYIPGEEIKAERAVLLEDFTGQFCVNCPEAHEVIKQLEEQYGKDKVIAVSIHCGAFGLSTSVTNFDRNLVGLMTDEGNSILAAYGITSFPMGVIDMGQPETFDLWPTSVRNDLQIVTDVDINVEAEYEPDAKDGENGYFGNIKVNAEIMSGSTRQANVQFWIVEDNIIAIQRSLSTTINDYEHDNVFRAQVYDGVKGQSVTLTEGFDLEMEGSIATRWTDKERWEINNLSVVAIVSDATGVLQVKKVKLVEDEEAGTDTES